MIFPMTDQEILQQLRSLSPEDLMAVWQDAPDPDRLSKRERMARELCQTQVIAAEVPPAILGLSGSAGQSAPAG